MDPQHSQPPADNGPGRSQPARPRVSLRKEPKPVSDTGSQPVSLTKSPPVPAPGDHGAFAPPVAAPETPFSAPQWVAGQTTPTPAAAPNYPPPTVPPPAGPGAPQFQIAPPPPNYPAAPPASRSRLLPLLIGGLAAAVFALALVIASVSGLFGGSEPDGTTGSAPESAEQTWGNERDIQTSAIPTPRGPRTPPLTGGPDGSAQRESCSAGETIPNAAGWPSRTGRGSSMTSCQFARNVGIAYWRLGSADEQPRRVVAPGAVPCQLGGSRCEGTDFVMDCRIVGNDDWVTCQGGRDAVVYLFGR